MKEKVDKKNAKRTKSKKKVNEIIGIRKTSKVEN